MGGGKQASRLWKHYFDSIDAVIFVIDSADKKRMFMVHEMLMRVNKDPNLTGVPFLVLLNKQDLENKLTTEEIYEELRFHKVLSDRSLRVQECSAKTGVGLWDGLN